MYAIIEVGGHQWKVAPGTRLDVNRVPTEVGSTHTVDRVLLAHDGQQAQIGAPYLAGVKVVCEVVSHPLSEKTIAYHFRRRENWRKTVGHRQPLTRLLVKEIQLPGAAPAEAAAEAPAKAAAKPRATRAGAGKSVVTRQPKSLKGSPKRQKA